MLERNNRGLSDKTKVGGDPWSELKVKALPEDYSRYQGEHWYTTLSDEEKDLLEDLISMQKEQGDMRPLK